MSGKGERITDPEIPESAPAGCRTEHTHDKNQSYNHFLLIRTVFLRRFSRVSAIFPPVDKNPLFASPGIKRCDLTHV